MEVIGITGKARSGKDTAANVFCKHFGTKRLALADPLKFICNALVLSKLSFEEFFLIINRFDSFYAPEKILDVWTELKSLIELYGITYESKKEELRPLYQLFGRLMRKISDGKFWIDILGDSLDEASITSVSGIVIPDVRFLNEANFLRKNYGAKIIRMIKTEDTPEISEECAKDSSETELDSIEADYEMSFPDKSVEKIEESVIRIGRDIFPCEKENPFKILSRTDFRPISFDKGSAVIEMACPFCSEKIQVTLNTFGKAEDVFKLFFFSCSNCGRGFSFKIHAFTIDNIFLYVGEKNEETPIDGC
jgi:hypothetical protein